MAEGVYRGHILILISGVKGKRLKNILPQGVSYMNLSDNISVLLCEFCERNVLFCYFCIVWRRQTTLLLVP